MLAPFHAYKWIPDAPKMGIPAVALGGGIGDLRHFPMALTQIEQMREWRRNGGGLLGASLRTDIVSNDTRSQFYSTGWKPEFVCRVPIFDLWHRLFAWIMAGWDVRVSKYLDSAWIDEIVTLDRTTTAMPYVTNIDLDAKVLTLGNVVLDHDVPGCTEWCIEAASAIRSRVGREGVGIDFWAESMKSDQMRSPSEFFSTPEFPRVGGIIMPVPWGEGVWEAAWQRTSLAMLEAGFVQLVQDIPRQADKPTKGGWLRPEVAATLLGHWRAEA